MILKVVIPRDLKTRNNLALLCQNGIFSIINVVGRYQLSLARVRGSHLSNIYPKKCAMTIISFLARFSLMLMI